MILDCLAVGPLEVNCYIWGEKRTNEVLLIDPGGSADVLLNLIETHGYKVKLVVNTHCHFDHVGAVSKIVRQLGTGYLHHQGDLMFHQIVHNQAAAWGFECEELPDASSYLSDGDRLVIGENKLSVIHTPGHSPGSICLWDEQNKILFSGDTLFQHSIGRSDLPGGSHETLIDSIKTKLLSLPKETIVYPGHGGQTQIGEEIKHNPFF